MSRRWNALVTLTLLACLAVASPGCKKESAGGGGGGPYRAPADLSTPKSTSLAFANAMNSGDKGTLRECVTGPEEIIRMMEAMSEVMPATQAMRKAADEKYGKDNALAKSFPVEKSANSVAKLESAEYKVEGETATVVKQGEPTEPRPMKLKKVGSQWKIDLAAMGAPPASDKAIKRFGGMAAAFKDVAGEIDAGKYPTAAAAETALKAKMASAMQAE